MNDSWEDEIRELVQTGNKLEAVKRYREEMGVGLAEAKDAVEAIAADDWAESGVAEVGEQAENSGLRDAVVEMLESGQKIAAVKLYREQTGLGLMEAKIAVEEIEDEEGLTGQSGSGCMGVILLVACLGATAWWTVSL